MPVPQVNIRNGNIINPPAELQYGEPFEWANPVVDVNVGISGCSGFATQDSYGVPGAPTIGAYGYRSAVLLQNPTNWTFTESPNEWNAPGSPRIINPPMNAEEKDVA
jgi:hypothetical protein